MTEKFDELIDGFMDVRVGVCEGFLSRELADSLQKDLSKRFDDGDMTPAGIGNGVVRDTDQKMRGDSIFWIDRNNANINEGAFLDKVEDFIQYLNRTCYTGINGYEFHYARYGIGSFYKRHRDQFKNNPSRQYSLISYLNNDWLETDGGHLKIFREDMEDCILPANGKAVFFKSDELEHEVSVAQRPRMSITGWLKRD